MSIAIDWYLYTNICAKEKDKEIIINQTGTGHKAVFVKCIIMLLKSKKYKFCINVEWKKGKRIF